MAAITERTVAAATLRDDVTVDDVVTLMNAAAWTREQQGAEAADRLIATTLRGMAPQAP